MFLHKFLFLRNLKSVKEISDKPVIAGFGISKPEQIEELCHECDGVVVGSKVVELFNENKINEIKNLIGTIGLMKEAVNE